MPETLRELRDGEWYCLILGTESAQDQHAGALTRNKEIAMNWLDALLPVEIVKLIPQGN